MFELISRLYKHPLSEYKNCKANWSRFEILILETLNNFWGLKKYVIQTQKISNVTGKRADFLLENPQNRHDRVVVDAKWTIKAQISHIEQIVEYKRIFKASRAILFYPDNVELTEEFAAFAIKKGVYIKSVETKKEKERQPGISGFFKPKTYPR